MKRYITVAAMIAAGAAFANADEEYTINPLLDSEAWSSTTKSSDQYASQAATISGNRYMWKEANIRGYSSYEFTKISLDSADDFLSFSYNLKTGNSLKTQLLTLALVGNQEAIVTGFTNKKPISYAVTDSIKKNYAFEGASWTELTLSGTALHSTLSSTKATGLTHYTVEGNITWEDSLSEFVLSLSVTETSADPVNDPVLGWITQETIKKNTPLTIAMGGSVDFSEFIITIDGASNAYPELYDLELTWGHIAVPEPSAFGLIAGLGVLALAGTRRRRR